MPVFNFSAASKPKAKTRSNNSSVRYEKIEKDVLGVICITLALDYFVEIGKERYPIVKEDYTSEGKGELYEQDLGGDKYRVRHIRSKEDRCKANTDYFLPFAPGCCVIGHIVKHHITKNTMFKIKKVFIDRENKDAKRSIRWYRNHYAQISEHRRKLQLEKENE